MRSLKTKKPKGGGQKQMQITEDKIKHTFKRVENELREATSTAKTEDQFKENLGLCQLYAQRMLAILIFNSSITGEVESETLLAQVVKGIRSEIEEMKVIRAENEDQLTSVEVELKKGDGNAH